MASFDTTIDQQLPDNTTGSITPAILRGVLKLLSKLGPNRRPALWKAVRFMTRAEANADPSGGEVFEELDFAQCCTFTSVWVEFYRATPTSPVEYGVLLRAAYDGGPSPQYHIQRSGGFLEAATLPARFVKVDSPAAAQANVPLYVAGTSYVVGYTVRYTVAGGQESFYYALKAGALPAPVAGGDANWKVVPGPVAPTSFAQELSLDQAQALDGVSVVAGRQYVISWPVNPQGVAQTVTLRGVSNNCFDVLGTLEVDSVRQAVYVNVATGSLVPQAPQTITSISRLRFYRAAAGAGNVYRSQGAIDVAGVYQLKSYLNVANIEIIKDGPNTRFNDAPANFPAQGMLYDAAGYTFILTPLDVNQSISLVFEAQV